jgi:hypothetical protein
MGESLSDWANAQFPGDDEESLECLPKVLEEAQRLQTSIKSKVRPFVNEFELGLTFERQGGRGRAANCRSIPDAQKKT